MPDRTAFQKLIRNILLTIHCGSTMTYGEIARKAAKLMEHNSMSAQEAGSAVGRNLISITIPYHRAI